MKTTIRNLGCLAIIAGFIIASSSCSKNGGGNTPPVDSFMIKYGYDSASQIEPASLVAHWNFNGNETEQLSGSNPTQTANATYVNGLEGKAISLDSGYLYYNQDIPALDKMTTFTVSAWVQIQNNGGTNGYTSMLFQLTKPQNIFGNINLGFETGWKPAANDTLVVHGWYTDPSGGLQDNRNDPFGNPPIGVVINPPNTWVNVMITCDNSNPVNFLVYANGKSIGAYNTRGTDNYTPITPTGIIIGGWINNVPGIYHTTDTWPHAFVGNIDELRVYNKVLTPAEITALYNLQLVGR